MSSEDIISHIQTVRDTLIGIDQIVDQDQQIISYSNFLIIYLLFCLGRFLASILRSSRENDHWRQFNLVFYFFYFLNLNR